MAPLRVTVGGLGNQNLERYALRLLPYTLPQYQSREILNAPTKTKFYWQSHKLLLSSGDTHKVVVPK